MSALLLLLPGRPNEAQGFIQTSSGNVISRKASIYKPQALEIPGGKVFVADGVHIRADIAPVQLQKYVHVGENAVIRPGYVTSPELKFVPVTVGAYTYIGPGSVVQAACIGLSCHIGANAIISARCILKDHVQVLDGAVLAPDLVVPPFAVVGGNPAQVLAFRSEAAAVLAQHEAVDRYEAAKPVAP